MLWLAKKFLTWFGDLKYFPYPMWIVWDPGSYKVKGEDAREVIELVRPGDILLRSYDNYVDGLFIPGSYSHVGLYVGEIDETRRAQAGGLLNNADEQARAQSEFFRTGPQMVIHAMAEGVRMDDVLTFCRCDTMAILRLPAVLKGAPDSADYPFHDELLTALERSVRDRLKSGTDVASGEVIPLAIEAALGKVGDEYDFGFDFNKFDSFSCSELIYFCYKSVDPHLDLRPKTHRFLGIFPRRDAITPDDYLSTRLEKTWFSRSARGR
jgi:hypothetical protein